MEESPGVVDTVHNIQRVLACVYKTIMQAFVQFNRMETSRHNQVQGLPDIMDEGESLYYHDAKNLTSFQNVLLFTLSRFEANDYRKCGDGVLKRVLTKHPEPYKTLAYKVQCTIKDEVYKLTKEQSWTMWKMFTNPDSNPDRIVKHITESWQAEFPEYDVGNGHYMSFEDGVYDMRYDLFFPYGHEHRWETIAQKVFRRRRDAQHPGPPEAYPVPSPTEASCVNHIEMDFGYDIENEDADFDPCSIESPSLNVIFSEQNFENNTIAWLYCFLGRMFFLIGVLENWQRFAMFWGGAGTGKSTLANWFFAVMPPQFYSILSSNMQDKFGMSEVAKDGKRACVCTEMTEDLSIKQEEFQLAVEGAEMNLNRKHKDSIVHRFVQHILAIGNQFPKKWNNDQDQITRRSYVFVFENSVPKERISTTLGQSVYAETPQILRRVVCQYVRFANLYGGKDLQSEAIIPQQVQKWMSKLTTAMNPLEQWFASCLAVVPGARGYTVERLQAVWRQWLKNESMPQMRWPSDTIIGFMSRKKVYLKKSDPDDPDEPFRFRPLVILHTYNQVGLDIDPDD